jgi:hypothetical protein
LESMMKLELAAGVDVDIKQYWEKRWEKWLD